MKRALVSLALFLGLITSLTLAAASRPLEGVINVNTASKAELMLLPGVGESKAEAIIAFRQQHPFKAPDELTEVKGIGPKMVKRWEKYLTIQGPTTLHELAAVSKAAAGQ